MARGGVNCGDWHLRGRLIRRQGISLVWNDLRGIPASLDVARSWLNGPSRIQPKTHERNSSSTPAVPIIEHMKKVVALALALGSLTVVLAGCSTNKVAYTESQKPNALFHYRNTRYSYLQEPQALDNGYSREITPA